MSSTWSASSSCVWWSGQSGALWYTWQRLSVSCASSSSKALRCSSVKSDGKNDANDVGSAASADAADGSSSCIDICRRKQKM